MLSGIRTRDSEKVFARESEKLDSPFTCPSCKNEVILKKGNIKIHHFAHKPPVTCQYGKGETEVHRLCKETIYLELKKMSHVTDLDIEANLGGSIADIYCRIKNIPIAIEIQRSTLSVSEITERTIKYEKLGIYVLWLALYNEALNKEKYSPSAWEKWCHATYLGRVYYWRSGLSITPVHYAEHKLYVPESSWYSDGGEQSAGGYFKPSKRWKTPKQGPTLNLVMDFAPTYKQSWRGGSVYIPNCRIYTDKHKKWW